MAGVGGASHPTPLRRGGGGLLGWGGMAYLITVYFELLLGAFQLL